MGQFRPMVKMYTTEPSVELKLKKGGHVSHSKKHGHKMMDGGVMTGLSAAPAPTRMQMGEGVLPSRAPARPSMAMRRKAMMARPMMNRPMMKEGGKLEKEIRNESEEIGRVKAKLQKHEMKAASKAHKGLKTGGVVMGQGGFKEGGAVPKSGILPVAQSERGAKGYVKTKMTTAQNENHTPKKTGEVVMGKPGGYKKGGMAMKYGGMMGKCAPMKKGGMMGGGMAYAKGGGVMNNVSTSKPGPTNTQTGEVKLGNAGGYKKGGAPKKHFATGGLVDSGKPVAYPKHFVSKPVANNIQSGTFKKGGKVKFNDGGAAGPVSNYERDMLKKNVKPVKDPEKIAAEASRGLDEALNPIGIFKELGSKLRDKLRGQGAVTETEKSVTVSPPEAKKRAGGAC